MIPDLVEQATTCQRHFANILSFSNWSCAGNEDVAWRFECFEVCIRVESDDLCILGIIIGQRHSKRVRQNGERSWRLILAASPTVEERASRSNAFCPLCT
ncbi:hypothetical protein KC338_g275 [Hortaea werneckii]|nr:hypothetical protein KC338_g275 [Hortaea werneckii]